MAVCNPTAFDFEQGLARGQGQEHSGPFSAPTVCSGNAGPLCSLANDHANFWAKDAVQQ